jgi:molybdate transport system substrate-binding protein
LVAFATQETVFTTSRSDPQQFDRVDRRRLSVGTDADATTMRLLSTLAVKTVLDELVPRFQLSGGAGINISTDPTALMLSRIRAGERGDLAILTADGIAALCASGHLVAASRRDLCVSEIGVAVPAGGPAPDISTVDAVRRTLLAVPSIGYSRAGASGIFFAQLIERLGIADAVNRKSTVIPMGFTAALLVDGTVDLAVQQVSELMAVPGVQVVGALPGEIQERLTFPGAIFADAAAAGPAAEFLAYLARPEFADVYRQAGLLPIGGGAV